jgi:hypothetical protein
MFYWKKVDIDLKEIESIQKRYKWFLPRNTHFFQPLHIGLTHFLGREVQRFVLIQVEPGAVGRIHTDYRPEEYGNQLALQIPLENCENSVTHIWESDYTPPLEYTPNQQPYNFFDPARCKLITSFNLTGPTFFRTDLPHSVDNMSNKIRKAISIRFKEDPWDLVGETCE